MSDQVFSDAEKQLIVRLSEDSLVYAAADRTGWKCRLADIAWTSSRISARGLQEVNLHAPNGHVAVTILHFDQIERLYVALLRRLTERPAFDGVRERLPTQVPLLERALWLAARTPASEGPWEALAVGEKAAAAATGGGLLLMPEADRVETIPWGDCAGVRFRDESSRFYRTRDWVEVSLPSLQSALRETCDRHLAEGQRPVFSIPNVRCAGPDLAMIFSWEIGRVRDDGLLEPDETLLACVYGCQGGLAPATGLAAPVTFRPAERSRRTELFLTDQRLLQVERDPDTGDPVSSTVSPLNRVPRIRLAGETLQIGAIDLEVDPGLPLETGRHFVETYRKVATERFDPFDAELQEGPRTGPPDGSAPGERLEELEELHRLGFVSDADYEKMRAEIAEP
jgi:hypothetical protein